MSYLCENTLSGFNSLYQHLLKILTSSKIYTLPDVNIHKILVVGLAALACCWIKLALDRVVCCWGGSATGKSAFCSYQLSPSQGEIFECDSDCGDDCELVR